LQPPNARHRLALVRTRASPIIAQYDRRHAARCRPEWWCGASHFYNAFIDENYRRAAEAQAKERDAAVKATTITKSRGQNRHLSRQRPIESEWLPKFHDAPLSSLIDHIDHVPKWLGSTTFGLGSDFDGVNGATPEGIDSAEDLPKITQALLDRGYHAEEIRKILGGNLLRVFADAERISRDMQSGKVTSADNSYRYRSHLKTSTTRQPRKRRPGTVSRFFDCAQHT